MHQKLTVEDEQAGQRLDVFCVAQFPQYSRAALQRAIKNEQLKVNGRQVKARYIIRAGDVIEGELPEPEEPAVPVEPSSLTIPIIYEDKDIVVVNKPYGIAVHPGQGKETSTVASWFKNRYPDVETAKHDTERPGIVHRLDKDTSGVLILAKTLEALAHLKDQFQRRRAHKEYVTLVFGIPGEAKGRITRPLARSKRNPLRRTVDPAGKEAATEWWVEEKLATKYTLLKIKPFTGRTHQIRVHMHFLGFPIVGDDLYTFKRQRPPAGVKRQLLHARKLSLRLLNGKTRIFEAPLPADFENVLQLLRAV